MILNWIACNYMEWDGYGRYSNRLIQALQRARCLVKPYFPGHATMPGWMQEELDIDWGHMTISCLPAFHLQRVPQVDGGRHWLLTMTEGSEAPQGWADIINESGVERVIVPCEYNADAFRRGGVQAPVHVVAGGTDPAEFPLLQQRREGKPYTFLSLADRGSRKGWIEMWDAFYRAFGAPDDTPDVRLIIKARRNMNGMAETIALAEDPDPRITVQIEDVAHPAEVYAQADCFAIPSRSEGWGMPHREAAMMGLPVITQRYSGMDDGYTDEWAIVVEGGKLEPIPALFEDIDGEWLRADVGALAACMRWCYEHPDVAALKGAKAAMWLGENQTWDRAARALLELVREHG